MRTVLVLWLLSHYFVNNEARYTENIYKTTNQTLEKIENDPTNEQDLRNQSILANGNEITPKYYFLNTSKKPKVHWLGEDSHVIIILTRDPTFSSISISYDDGDTYVNKTDHFKTENGSYAILEKLYYHPTNNSHIVFTDIINNRLYVTTNYGHDIQRIELNFTPSDVSFHELNSSVFVILDKNDGSKLWITDDFGQSFHLVETSVGGYYWVKGNNLQYNLVVQRRNANGSSDILYSDDLHSKEFTVYGTDVEDFFVKDDYLFMTKLKDESDLDLQISYKLGKKIKCNFPSTLPRKGYFVVDVTNNRILIVVSHSSTASHLYVSEIFDNGKDVLEFFLSLEDVVTFFPNRTWHNTWLSNASTEAFADVHKIRGVSGVYIASKVLTKPQDNNLDLDNVGSVITYDHGRTWHMISPPHDDSSKPCLVQNGCSLHLGQRLSQLRLERKSIRIISSKSAPGIILASGVLGRSLNASNYKVYISTDVGLTWRETLPDSNFYNMGDFGGILIAAKSDIATRKIMYSINEGKTWENIPLAGGNLKIHDLRARKAEKSTVFNIVAFSLEKEQWVSIELNLIKAFDRGCSKEDYGLWSPNDGNENDNRKNIPCVLGEQHTYQRRESDVNCYNGENFEPFVSTRPCGCDYHDFECDLGFERSRKGGHCIRNTNLSEDIFKVPSTCETGESYNVTRGYHKILGDNCIGGFESHYQPREIPCSSDDNPTFMLIAANRGVQKFNLLTQKFEVLLANDMRNILAVEYDMKQKCLYWADETPETLERQCSHTSEPEILLSHISVDGMSLDWISNNLYFIDSGKKRIQLIKVDANASEKTRRTIIGPDILKDPKGIAVHPEAGYLFWTDCSSRNPSVSRATLDGTNVKELFTSPIVKQPIGITIDFIAERIYWTDDSNKCIVSSDLHGNFFEKIISDSASVTDPYGIAVFKNNIYWNNWLRGTVFTSDKDHSHPTKIYKDRENLLRELKIYGHGMQVGTNACERNNCSNICVGTPEKFVCLSPDQGECGRFNFTCADKSCVPQYMRCDHENDCEDNSDEAGCPPETCGANHFVCGNGRCIPLKWRCDGENDCKDKSDETDCSSETSVSCGLKVCNSDELMCDNGRCVPRKWECDGDNDCKDKSDEANCSHKTCEADHFMCGNYLCIPMFWRCDEDYDCDDHSDEVGCNNGVNCSLANGNCTQENNKADVCGSDEFECGVDAIQCISTSKRCDGVLDCPDGSDENGCVIRNGVEEESLN